MAQQASLGRTASDRRVSVIHESIVEQRSRYGWGMGGEGYTKFWCNQREWTLLFFYPFLNQYILTSHNSFTNVTYTICQRLFIRMHILSGPPVWHRCTNPDAHYSHLPSHLVYFQHISSTILAFVPSAGLSHVYCMWVNVITDLGNTTGSTQLTGAMANGWIFFQCPSTVHTILHN